MKLSLICYVESTKMFWSLKVDFIESYPEGLIFLKWQKLQVI